MGISMLTLDGLFTSVHEAAAWLFGWRPADAAPVRAPARASHGHGVAAVTTATVYAAPQRVSAPARRIIVRSREGRVVISGRMADVCAELERLAAQEALQACAPAR